MSKKKIIIITFLILFLFYFLISYIFFNSNFISETSLKIIEKTRVFYEYNNLENLDLFYPFTPFLVNILFRNILISKAFIGAFVVTFMIFFVNNHLITKTLKIGIPILLVLSPSLIYMINYKSETMLYSFFIILSFYYLLQFTHSESSFYIFMFGLFMGFSIFTHVEIILFLPFLFFILFLIFFNLKNAINYLFISIFPMIFFLFSLFYLNFIYNGTFNLLNFIIKDFEIYNFFNIWKYFSYEYIIIYIFLYMMIGRFKRFYTSSYFLISISPFIVQLIHIFFDKNLGHFLGIIPLLSFIIIFPYTSYFVNEKKFKYFIIFIGILLTVFGYFKFYNSEIKSESDYLNVLFNKNSVYYTEEYKIILNNIETGKKIITDNNYSYGIIALYDGNLNDFILSYNRIYDLAYSNPKYFSDYIIVSKNLEDTFYNYHNISDFYVIKETKNFYVIKL
ncbi:hypothetical protein [Oceanotoga teriensis]|uniref:hypothetical protein n=1 Tax=Oceanotoga teriensis TaxID=515440 RepID=UPI0027134351|nr:hypothetical protein [Oceanotoga teriensis]MDO7977265.1 hypothetical protein [Oceanotoga teriensis]